MDYIVKSSPPKKLRSQCLVVGVFQGHKLTPAAAAIDKATNGLVQKLLKRGDIKGKAGQTLLLPNVTGLAAERVLLVGCGKQREFDGKTLRKAVTAAARVLDGLGVRDAAVYLGEAAINDRDITARLQQIVIDFAQALYRFDRLKTTGELPKRVLKKVLLCVPERDDVALGETAVKGAVAIAGGTALARDLGNLPGNICNPEYLASEARRIADDYAMRCEILDEPAMEELGMGALLSVSRGSRQPARLIVLEHRGGKPDQAPVVLVGKGLTFDAGGISLKPAEAMDEMKFDMCGGASVLGTMQAIGQMQLPLNVIGIVPSSENLPDGDANKPGDVVTSMSGQTIEILNTDAEGRLILCDALTYCERFKPAAVVDIATLTGACVIALGDQASGLLSNHEPLARDLLAAGEQAMDRAWQLPLWPEYDEQLKSNFADMANVGGRKAGTITAASFLARYTKKFHWAHLDIAGTAWLSGNDKGATGRPVGLLCQFLRNRAGH